MQKQLRSERSIIPRYRKVVVPGIHTARNHDFISFYQGTGSLKKLAIHKGTVNLWTC